MITNGFTYIAVLVFIAALLVWLQRYTKSKFFDYAPPIVLLYLITMILCTLGAWDMEATKPAYSVLKNNLLYAMIFLMLLRCDIRKIIKLGPKMLGGFFAASVSISVAFIATFAIMKGPLGSEAWKALGALCGSWMGGSGNMIAVQAALDIGEADMAYALVVDSIDYSIWVMFLLWAINLAPKFNKWVKADTTTLDEVSRRLEEDAKSNEDKATFVNLIFLLGLALVISAFGQDIGAALNSAMPFLDKATWTVLLITLSGLIGAVTPVGRMAGSTELSNLLLYSVVALLASRASFLELTDAPAWILAGFMILAIHGIILVLLAKIFHLDMFTCGVASLANIGGFICLGNGAFHTLCAFGKNQFRAVGFQQIAALHAHGLGHHDDDAVALGSCHGGQTDAGVAGGGLDDDGAFLQQALFLGIIDHLFLAMRSLTDPAGLKYSSFANEAWQKGAASFSMWVSSINGGVADQLVGGSIDLAHCSFLPDTVTGTCCPAGCPVLNPLYQHCLWV